MTTDLEILRADLAAARLQGPRTRLVLCAAAAALTISAAAFAASHYLGEPAPPNVQADIHRTAVTLFAGSPGLVKSTARVVATSRSATLYGISDLKGNYCVELVGADVGLVWSFSCDSGLRVGGSYRTPGATGLDQVASVVVAGHEPPVVQWGRLTSGTVAARATYGDGTTEQIPIGAHGFFVYQPSDKNQARARRMPMTIQFLRGDGSPALSTLVLPSQPLSVQGHPGGGRGTIRGRVVIDGAEAIEVDEWGNGRRPGTHFVPLRRDGTFSITWRRGHPALLSVVDRDHKRLTDYLQALPESFWRKLVSQARGPATPDVRKTQSAATRLNWTDVQALTTGGRIVYRTRKIAISGNRYSVSLSMTNESSGELMLSTYRPGPPSPYIGPESFGIAYREAANPNITTRRLINARASTFAPALPGVLEPGQTWTGTFSGSAQELRHHHTWWIVFGHTEPGGYWISDKAFST